MSEEVAASLERALELTLAMLDAAGGGNWDRVRQLDEQRQRHLRKPRSASLNAAERELSAALRKHNQTLLARAELARTELKQQLDRHQYNHRALRTYISSSA